MAGLVRRQQERESRLVQLVHAAEKIATSKGGQAQVLQQLLATEISLSAASRRTEGARVMFLLATLSLSLVFAGGVLGLPWFAVLAPSGLTGAFGLTGAVLAGGGTVTMKDARLMLATASTFLPSQNGPGKSDTVDEGDLADGDEDEEE